MNSGLFSDVTFELDDGHIKSHRAMLIARCDVMRAMLNGDFREAHSNVVSKKFVVAVTFSAYRMEHIIPDHISRRDAIHISQISVLHVHR